MTRAQKDHRSLLSAHPISRIQDKAWCLLVCYEVFVDLMTLYIQVQVLRKLDSLERA